jgi:hypothetical protein
MQRTRSADFKLHTRVDECNDEKKGRFIRIAADFFDLMPQAEQ